MEKTKAKETSDPENKSVPDDEVLEGAEAEKLYIDYLPVSILDRLRAQNAEEHF